MKFLKQVSLYTLVGVLSAGINFFVMPVLSHYLSPADYGLLSLLNTYVIILVPLVSLSANSLLSIDFFKDKNTESFAGKFTSLQILPLFTTVFLGLITWRFYGQFADDLELHDTGAQWGFIILAITLLTIYFDQFIQFLVLQKKAATFAVYSLLKVAVEVLLTLYFVIYKGWGWEGRMYSSLLSTAVFLVLGFIYFKRIGLLRASISFSYIRQGIVFGAPLILHGIGKFVVNQSDRLFITKMVSIDEAGVYNIGYTVGMMVLIAVNAFFNYFSPFLMERLAHITEEKKVQIVKMGYIYGAGCLLLLLLIVTLAPLFFHYLIDHRYSSGAKYVFWVALGYCFWGGYMFFTGFISFYHQNRILGWLAVFNVLCNLVLNYFFIKAFGAIGAAYATTLSFFFQFVLVAFKAHQLMPLPWLNYREARAAKLT